MRIVQLANFYSPTSGGLRTAVDAVGRGYVAAGHERVLIVPGAEGGEHYGEDTGLVVSVPGTPVGAGYRMVVSPVGVLRLLERLRPDSVEVSDKATLTVVAGWARRHGVRSVLWSHERLDDLLAVRIPGGRALRGATRGWTKRLLARFDAVVVTSWFAFGEFASVGRSRGPGGAVVRRVPLGVDLKTFRPGAGVGRTAALRLVAMSRLSPEKRPDLVLATLAELVTAGWDVRLDMIGDGPERARLERMARRLPVRFHGYIASRAEVARLLGAADVAVATCPVESFGLSVLETLACGTPVVAAARGAAPELLAPHAGVAVPPSPSAMAAGVAEVAGWPPAARRAARRRAEDFPWDVTVAGMLAVHGDTPGPGTRLVPAPPIRPPLSPPAAADLPRTG